MTEDASSSERYFKIRERIMPILRNKDIFFILLVLGLASCSSAPHYRRAPEDSTTAAAFGREKIIQVARSYIGTRYVRGGVSRNGVDCSGLVVAVFRTAGIELPRTATEQAKAGNLVSRDQLKPGDLVFFHTTRWMKISHAGIYLGKGNFIHASTRARKVRIDSMNSSYFRNRFILARSIPQLY